MDAITTQILEKEMRSWLLDCFNDEYDQETIENLSFESLKKSVNRYFEGGFNEFILCSCIQEQYEAALKGWKKV